MAGDWFFNLRTTGSISDASSDSDTADTDRVGGGNPPSVARLLREFDLSTRDEAVEYRPNPWSIAKINATLRTGPQHINRSTEIASSTKAASSKAIAKQGPIEAAFKKQADRVRTTQCSVVEQPAQEEKARPTLQKERRMAVPNPPHSLQPPAAVFPRCDDVQNRLKPCTDYPEPLHPIRPSPRRTALVHNAHRPVSSDNLRSTLRGFPTRALADDGTKREHRIPLPHPLRQTENRVWCSTVYPASSLVHDVVLFRPRALLQPRQTGKAALVSCVLTDLGLCVRSL